jgi:hypothetical protein
MRSNYFDSVRHGASGTHFAIADAGSSPTRTAALPGGGSNEALVVGETGFEPATARPPAISQQNDDLAYPCDSAISRGLREVGAGQNVT